MPEHVLSKLKRTAERLPDKIAFADENGAITFDGLYRVCRTAGTFLHAHGFEEEPVVVCMEKTHVFAAALFGVLAGGCAYVPVDAETPMNRLAEMLNKTKVRAVICDDATEWLVNSAVKALRGDVRVFLWEDICTCSAADDTESAPASGTTEIIPMPADDWTGDGRACFPETVSGDAPAYIMFTSGSTGAPKGVLVTHANLDAYVSRLIGIMDFSEDTVFANQTPFSTDASMKELYPTVLLGATTWIIPKMCFAFPATLISFLNEHRVNTICWAASAYALTAGMGALEVAKPAFLKTAAFGSEPLAVAHLRTWMEACPGVRFTNLYGPTEATGVCCYYHVESLPEKGSVIPAGIPFPDAVLSVRNEEGVCLPDGETGEVWIAGPQVAQGYTGDVCLTGERFVTDENGLRCYRSGDLGFFDENGMLVLTGRVDFQIKHLGYRIEPAEIEAQGYGVDGITMCCCVYDKTGHQIVLFHTGDAAEQELRARLKDRLPRHMQPARYVHLDAMPLNRNGKVDRRRLLQDL